MTTWDGVGLPPAAQSRIERARVSGVKSSLFSVPGHVGVESCGFSPVGEVMGCIVEYIGFQGYGGCGWGYGYQGGMGWSPAAAAPPPVITSGSNSGWGGFAPYVNALYHGWDTALDRMLTEANRLGADGVVGVSLTEARLGAGNREFLALGTAVRSHGETHLSWPFATTLAGQDLAKLVHSGWMPAAIAVGISVGIRHNDYRSRMSQSAWAGNAEVPGFTELVNETRADARHQLSRRLARIGAEGAILDGPVRLAVHEYEVGENHQDLVGESSVLASAIVRFHRAETLPPSPLRIMPLSGPGTTIRRRSTR